MLRRRFAVVIGLLLTGTACADSPTLSNSPAEITAAASPGYDEVQGCVTDPDGVCQIGGIVVDPGAPPPDCNVWYSPSCGECMTGSVIDPDDMRVSSACPGGGGGIGPGPGGGADPYAPGGGGGSTSPPAPLPCPDYDYTCESTPPPPDTCVTGERIVDDRDVFGTFDALWQQSLQRGVELGGWIVQEGYSNYRLIPFQNAVYTACGVDIFDAPPPNLVSIFHTHPWRMGQSRDCNGTTAFYTGTPSPEDVQTLRELGLSTGYFIDYTGVGKYSPADESATRFGRCGY
jgi:hypothetical protein